MIVEVARLAAEESDDEEASEDEEDVTATVFVREDSVEV